MHYKVRKKVWLRSDQYISHTSASDKNKLRELCSGPYTVKKVLPNAVELDLPTSMKISPTVNVTKVKLHVDPIKRPVEPGRVLEEGRGCFLFSARRRFERACSTLSSGKITMLLITAGPEAELANAPEVLREFESSR